jgi:hypothetical protein
MMRNDTIHGQSLVNGIDGMPKDCGIGKWRRVKSIELGYGQTECIL